MNHFLDSQFQKLTALCLLTQKHFESSLPKDYFPDNNELFQLLIKSQVLRAFLLGCKRTHRRGDFMTTHQGMVDYYTITMLHANAEEIVQTIQRHIQND